MWNKNPLHLFPCENERWNSVKQQLSNIWGSSVKCPPQNQAAVSNLNHALSNLVARLKNEGMVFQVSSSPSGQCHIIRTDWGYVFVSIYGYLDLIHDWGINGDEFWLTNFYWMESDHIVFFDEIRFSKPYGSYIFHYSYDQDSFLCAMKRKNLLADHSNA